MYCILLVWNKKSLFKHGICKSSIYHLSNVFLIDSKRRYVGLMELEKVLSKDDIPLQHRAELFSALFPCLRDKNTKCVYLSMNCILLMIKKEYDLMITHGGMIVEQIMERCGDGKSNVREKASDCIVHMIALLGATKVYEHVKSGLKSKNHYIRNEVIIMKMKNEKDYVFLICMLVIALLYDKFENHIANLE